MAVRRKGAAVRRVVAGVVGAVAAVIAAVVAVAVISAIDFAEVAASPIDDRAAPAGCPLALVA
jgi:hypothetical protein